MALSCSAAAEGQMRAVAGTRGNDIRVDSVPARAGKPQVG